METEDNPEPMMQIECPTAYEISLTQEQANYINSLLPKCFSLQLPIKKPRKTSRDLDSTQVRPERKVHSW